MPRRVDLVMRDMPLSVEVEPKSQKRLRILLSFVAKNLYRDTYPCSHYMLSTRATARTSLRLIYSPIRTAVKSALPPVVLFNPIRLERSFTMTTPVDLPKASSSAMPEWVRPIKEVQEPVLKVYNSLTRTKVRR